MKQDSATKEYFSDTNYTSSGVQRIRDIIKEVPYDMAMKTDGVRDYIIVGIENQTKIDYGMVVRTLLYDGLAYDRQMKEIKQGRRNERSYYGYLHKTDCLNPVVTIVIYYGEEKWDGKTRLRDLVRCPKELKEFIPEYKLHLLEVHQLKEEELERFHTEIQKVFQAIQVSKDREKMEELFSKDEYYKRVDVESAKFINSMTNLEIEIKGKHTRSQLICVKHLWNKKN